MSTFLLRAAAGFVAICKANASLVCVYTPIYTYTIFYFNCSIFNGLLIKKKKNMSLSLSSMGMNPGTYTMAHT